VFGICAYNCVVIIMIRSCIFIIIVVIMLVLITLVISYICIYFYHLWKNFYYNLWQF